MLSPTPLNSTYSYCSFNFSTLFHGKTYFKSCLKGNELLLPPSSYYVLILIGLFFLTTPLWLLQIHISSTGLYLEFYTYIYNTFRPSLHGSQSDISHLAKTEHRLSSCSFCPPQTSRWHLHQLALQAKFLEYPWSLYFLYIHIQSISRFCWAISQSIHHSISWFTV